VPKEKADRMVTDAQNLLADESPSTRMEAGRALAEMDSTASIDLMRNAIQKEPGSGIRLMLQLQYLTLLPSAIKSMPKAQADLKIVELQGLLQDKDRQVRTLASHGLAQVGSTASFELIRDALLHEDDPSLCTGMQRDFLALLPSWYKDAPKSQTGPIIAEAEHMLAGYLPLVRMDAAHALAQIGSISSIDSIRAAIRNEKIDGARVSM